MNKVDMNVVSLPKASINERYGATFSFFDFLCKYKRNWTAYNDYFISYRHNQDTLTNYMFN